MRTDTAMIVYKATDHEDRTRPGEYNETLWGEGFTSETDGQCDQACNAHWLHSYPHPVTAVMLDYEGYLNGDEDRLPPRKPGHLWLARIPSWTLTLQTNGIKIASAKLTTLHRIKVPKFTKQEIFRAIILMVRGYFRDHPKEITNPWTVPFLAWLDKADKPMANSPKKQTLMHQILAVPIQGSPEWLARKILNIDTHDKKERLEIAFRGVLRDIDLKTSSEVLNQVWPVDTTKITDKQS